MNPATGTPATTHEVLALAMIATLKQTADYNISNKLLKVSYQSFTCRIIHNVLICSIFIDQQGVYLQTNLTIFTIRSISALDFFPVYLSMQQLSLNICFNVFAISGHFHPRQLQYLPINVPLQT